MKRRFLNLTEDMANPAENIKIGVIGLPGKMSSEKLADAVAQKTGFRLLIDMAGVDLNLETDELWYQGEKLSALDALIIKKIGTVYSPHLLDRLECLRFLNERGLKCFSSPQNIIRLLNRLSCTITLKSHHLPMPPTKITENIDTAVRKVQEYGEAILKPLYSTKARGMVLVRPGDDVLKRVSTFKKENPLMYIQKKMALNGYDLGVVFLGGEYLTTYARLMGDMSWNTTIHSGGKYGNYAPSQSIIDLAKKAQDLFGLDFTCVDIAEPAEGPVILEVSAFGGFSGVYHTSSIDVADRYVDYVLARIKS